jgi:hypothetical protein
MRSRNILRLSILGLLLVACAEANSPTPTLFASRTDSIPTPASTLIEQFVWQTDGLCGYRMLRPDMWIAAESECRIYVPPDLQDRNNQVILRVANYQVMAQQQTEGILAPYELFKKDPSLEGWTKGVEQMWQSNGLESSLEAQLPRAKIYSLRSPGASDIQLIALAIDQDQPLVIGLNASGEYADLERLRNEHLWDDFVAMVNSVSAINYDPGDVVPSLPTSAQTHTTETPSPNQGREHILIGDKCNSENCLFFTQGEPDWLIGVATVVGYYVELERSAFEQTKRCDSFVITDGAPALVQSLLSLIAQGNTLYTKNDLDQPIISLDLNNLSELEKQRLISSSAAGPTALVLLAPNPPNYGVPVCFSHFEILRVE